MHGIMAPGPDPKSPVPCGQQATTIVWHGRPGERQYAMCTMCADHNITNRNARLLLTADPLGRERWDEIIKMRGLYE